MCLAVPAKVVSIEGEQAVADIGGSELTIATALVPELKAGDWVLVHAGFAITRLDEQTALETWQLLKQMYQPEASAGEKTQ